MSELNAGDVRLDVCRSGCGGIWFDRDELFKFDEPHEFDPSELLQIAKEKESVKVDSSKKKNCPKCENQPLVRQFFDVQKEVEFDQCWECAGVWLDVGEINTIRGQYETHEDRVKASNVYIVEELKKAQSAMDVDTRKYLAGLDARYDKSAIARAMGFFQRLIGVEDKTNSLLDDQIFSADFDKLS